MYAQDTSIEQALPWPGFGYNGTGADDQPFQGFFNRSSSGPIPLNVAKAWLLQGKLVTETSHRVKVNGSSEDGFAALAGISTDRTKVQVLLNNYQFDYDIAREITTKMVRTWTRTSVYLYSNRVNLLGSYVEQVCFGISAHPRKWPLVKADPERFMATQLSLFYTVLNGESTCFITGGMMLFRLSLNYCLANVSNSLHDVCQSYSSQQYK